MLFRSIEIDGDRIAEAFRNAAINGLRSFLAGLEEGLAKSEPEAKPKPAKKPKKAKTRSAAGSARSPGA